ncbi:hypothetical protein [Nonomuraea basaltis]|uniref:hypothetical protein n=1 Tax=Nonomuraea basaltis TaxID=2495887 RepID=UPI00110C5E76|nr:hypothetical protein [Nonomuraea basaltis]TMS00147.1 hypothetical protein EJK15_03485 [Nonomuraea basaltis]
MASIKVRLAVRDVFLARLAEVGKHRDERWDEVPGLYGPEPGWVIYEAEQMLALVNEIRSGDGLPLATLEQVLRIERSASGHSDYPDKYALRCAFLALGEED